MEKISKILEIGERVGFFKRVHFQKIGDCLQVGPTGFLLQKNIENEWLNNVVINKDFTVFLSSNNFEETFNFAKNICSDFPFGVAEIFQNEKSFGSDIFKFRESIKLKSTIFVAPAMSSQIFYQIQKQRRTFWRKFSASPSKYFLSDTKINHDTQSADILVNYPWGDFLLESLSLFTSPEKFNNLDLQVKTGKKHSTVHCISTELCLQSAVINTICDAYDEPLFQGNPRPLFHFHRKLAPYKISFAIASSQGSTLKELNDLALYLCRLLRNNHVSTLLLPSSSKLTLNDQWRQYDQLGVPYNVLLNEGTVKNGICYLRSRETTLKEQVHVTELVGYVEKLFKNY